MSMLETCFRNVTREYMIARLHHVNFPRNVPTVFGIFFLFSEPNNYCLDRAAPGQLFKCNNISNISNCDKCLTET